MSKHAPWLILILLAIGLIAWNLYEKPVQSTTKPTILHSGLNIVLITSEGITNFNFELPSKAGFPLRGTSEILPLEDKFVYFSPPDKALCIINQTGETQWIDCAPVGVSNTIYDLQTVDGDIVFNCMITENTMQCYRVSLEDNTIEPLKDWLEIKVDEGSDRIAYGLNDGSLYEGTYQELRAGKKGNPIGRVNIDREYWDFDFESKKVIVLTRDRHAYVIENGTRTEIAASPMIEIESTSYDRINKRFIVRGYQQIAVFSRPVVRYYSLEGKPSGKAPERLIDIPSSYMPYSEQAVEMLHKVNQFDTLSRMRRVLPPRGGGGAPTPRPAPPQPTQEQEPKSETSVL